jgi:hypothetical protein
LWALPVPGWRIIPVCAPPWHSHFWLCSVVDRSKLQQESLGPIALHDTQAIVCSDLVLHAVQIILYRLLRQVKMIADLFVGHALRDQGDELLLPPRESNPLSYARQGTGLDSCSK